MAIDRYTKEKSSGNEDVSEGNTSFRLFEIVTGLKRINFESSNSGLQYEQAVNIGDGETRLNYFRIIP